MENNNWLKDKLDSIETKVDRLDGRSDTIDITLAKQSVQLEEHIRRTELAEMNINLLKDQISSNKEETKNDLKPIQTHVVQVHMVLKLIGVVASVASIVKGIFYALEIFKSF